MKPIHCDFCIGQLLRHATEKGRGHVTDCFPDVGAVAAMNLQKLGKLLQGLLAFARGGKQYGFLAFFHVDEDRHVVVHPLAGSFIQTDGFDARQFKLRNRLVDIMFYNAP